MKWHESIGGTGNEIAHILAAWWAWLEDVEVIIRWPRREREDWINEGGFRWF